jgi:hypothetical protein
MALRRVRLLSPAGSFGCTSSLRSDRPVAFLNALRFLVELEEFRSLAGKTIWAYEHSWALEKLES